jgi:prepilin-type N-terminal cleavage/methylation domain-containing protein
MHNKNGGFSLIEVIVVFIICAVLAAVSIPLYLDYKQNRVANPKVTATSKNLETHTQQTIEWAYYQGQKNALEGDIRIQKRDSLYVWIKSPWDGGKEPSYDPSWGDHFKDEPAKIYPTTTAVTSSLSQVHSGGGGMTLIIDQRDRRYW